MITAVALLRLKTKKSTKKGLSSTFTVQTKNNTNGIDAHTLTQKSLLIAEMMLLTLVAVGFSLLLLLACSS